MYIHVYKYISATHEKEPLVFFSWAPDIIIQ